jgi:hypothetical protein
VIVDLRSEDRSKRVRARVWIDDEEVSNDCFYADSDAGVVRGYARNELGLVYIIGGIPGGGVFYKTAEGRKHYGAGFGALAEFERHGVVRIEPPQ